MTYLNELAAVFGILMLLNAGRGFWPPMWRKLKTGTMDAQALTFLSILILDAKGIVRMAYWDLFRPLGVTGTEGSVHGTIANTLINTAAGFGGLALCAALYMTIPKGERVGWNWLTAPWYPSGLRIWRRR